MEMFSGKCRKHQTSNNKQQPGICSVCLRDRLLQLAEAYNHNTTLHNPIPTDDRCSSFSSTSTSSPIYFSNNKSHNKHVRNASDVVRSISYVIGGGSELKKSRSIATTNMIDGRSNNNKRGSFWKKLLKIRGSKAMMVKGRFDN